MKKLKFLLDNILMIMCEILSIIMILCPVILSTTFRIVMNEPRMWFCLITLLVSIPCGLGSFYMSVVMHSEIVDEYKTKEN